MLGQAPRGCDCTRFFLPQTQQSPEVERPGLYHQPSFAAATRALERCTAMVPDKPPPTQARPQDPWPPRPCICPHCGHSHRGYDQQASILLDCLTLATDALHEAKRLIEEEVLP